MTTLQDTFTAVLARIEAMGEDVSDHKIVTIVERIVADGVAVADVNDPDFFRLLSRNHIEDETALPCPSWCQDEPGHGFEWTHALTGMQVRKTCPTRVHPAARSASGGPSLALGWRCCR